MKNQDENRLTDEFKLDLAMQFMAAVKNGNRELMGSLLTDDATWVFPGDNLLSGIARGIGPVADKAALVVSYGISIEHTKTLYSLNGLGLLLHNQGRRDHYMLDEILHSTISFSRGKIDSIETYLSDIPGMDAFFGGKPTGDMPMEVLDDAIKYKIGEDFIRSLKSRDWGLMRSLLHQDVLWTLPGTSLLSGPATGADNVISRANQLRDFGVMIEVNQLLVGLEGVALSLHNTASRGELLLDQQVAIVCKLQDGKIISITTHLNDVAGINSFFTNNN